MSLPLDHIFQVVALGRVRTNLLPFVLMSWAVPGVVDRHVRAHCLEDRVAVLSVLDRAVRAFLTKGFHRGHRCH